MTTSRCNILVKDPISHRFRKCQKNVSMYTRCICSTHARTDVIKIQKWIRGYLLRKRLKIFSELPSDVWNRVLYYIIYQNNVQQCFQKSIDNIYNGKINSLKNKMRLMSINGSIYEADGEEIKMYKKYMYEADRLIYNRNYAIDLINMRRVILF
jgi:hypothetical protein